jgi:hypothetical protein
MRPSGENMVMAPSYSLPRDKLISPFPDRFEAGYLNSRGRGFRQISVGRILLDTYGQDQQG